MTTAPSTHHSNENNAMRLVDDLMEPFRPLVDYKVWQLSKTQPDITELTPENKRTLANILYADMPTRIGATPVSVCMQKLAVSLAQVYMEKCEQLELPFAELPMELAGI